MKRRQWLQMSGGAIATLGMNQLDLEHKALRYAGVLAQGTGRKRALLVGINKYTGTSKGEWLPLQGAVNDVELQRELLSLRFGFKDIQVLTDEKVTRANIVDTFNHFLIQGAKPGDVVVFHFSGHGSNVNDPDKVHDDGLTGTIVPYDHELPFGYPNTGGVVNDITAGTLFLLMAALKQKDVTNVTVVLDSCYAGAGVRGNLIVRSRPGEFELRGNGRTSKLEMNPRERDEQQRWLKALNLPKDDWIKLRRGQIANGVALLAAARNQQAVDAVFAKDIHAGVFTQALTRYLWQQTEAQTLNIVMTAAQSKTEKFLKTVPNARTQTPFSEVAPGTRNDQKSIYFSPFQTNGSADAVIKQVRGNQVKVLLTVDPGSVEALGRGAQLKLVDDTGAETGILHIESRNQLEAQGTLQRTGNAKLHPGADLQEQIRAIPKDITLRIGLDRSLAPDIETAKQLLQAMPRIEALPLLQQEVHYILGRKDGQVGLFSPGFDPLPDSPGEVGETVTAAIKRLQAQFSLLLAARILKLMLNTQSSRLKVSAAMRVANSKEILAQSFTVRGGGKPMQTIQSLPATPVQPLSRLKVGQTFQLVVQNQEAQLLYIGVVFVNPDGTVLLYPTEQQLAANQEMVIPAQDGIELQPPLGVAEVLIIASAVSLERALSALSAIRQQQQATQRGQATIDAVGQLLDDLDAGTRGSKRPASDVRLVDTRQMAALSIAFEIVA
ncbi:caspase family protein [Stenomitos frigidus]|uniref:Peptidase C14, caspase catalytic subunit p20 n=1 Tax=Stenomitos frigidus ULC18 TaxID=2107698 RepID=A0A2T1ES58_9CYAN|nr:caspase family protein [Stenomitos frigidus]PSB35582.1 peptidase C14, caspase catalytic subunit p20 [Stenomitos frigidus ULC18]